MEAKDWQVGKSLAMCLKHMLDHEMACDVTFQIQFPGEPNKSLPAHKLMLTARSPVFEAMFSGAYMERSGDVIITDISVETFNTMLQYIYTDDATLTAANVMHVLYTAKKYILDGLVAKCTEFLDNKIALNNVCGLLTDSILYQDNKINTVCLHMIARNIKALTKMEEFYCLSHDALLLILKSDLLNHGVESDLFEVCLEWAKRQLQADGKVADDAEIRRVLGKCLHQIRFPYISAQEFADKFGKSSVLTGEEKSTILCLGLAKPQERRTHIEWLASHGFNTASRIIHAQRYAALNVDTLDVSATKAEKFVFKVKKDVMLIGLSVLVGDTNADYTIKISISQLPEANISAKLCYDKVYKLRAPGNNKMNYPVALDKPFALRPNIGYAVVVTMQGTSPVKLGRYRIRTITTNGWSEFPTTDSDVSFWQCSQEGEAPKSSSSGQCGFVPNFFLQRF